MNIDYIKNDNKDLFLQFKNENLSNFTEIQNYIPVYKEFFNLTNKNYKNVNFKLNNNLKSLVDKVSENKFLCEIENSEKKDIIKKNVYLKFAHLIDPIKYMLGKYKDVDEEKFFRLPIINENSEIENSENNYLDKYNLIHNSSYIDGLFSFISSKTKEDNFIHANDFYGMFLGIQKNYKIDVSDDLEYLFQSEYFHNKKNILFSLESNDNIYLDKSYKYKKPLQIINDNTNLEIDEFPNELLNTIFISPLNNNELDVTIDVSNNKIKENIIYENLNNNNTSRKTDDSGSTCSSSSSKTENNNSEGGSEEEDSDEGSDEGSDEDSDEGSEEELNSYGIINKYPTLVIATECCEITLDEYMNTSEINNNEWKSILFQIIVILIKYQKLFDFTHNDLHNCNVVFEMTEREYLYYKIDNVNYKVPSYGKVYKIIDFGRAIFKINEKRFCSDCFNKGEDADSQYNCEPFITKEKPIIEPNNSFDLCRFGCSMYDYFIDDIDEEDEVCKKNPIANLIRKWCLDDNEKNILYKKTGEERYPEFKLYKMIARNVHHHIPIKEIKNKLFEKFITNSKSMKNIKKNKIMII